MPWTNVRPGQPLPQVLGLAVVLTGLMTEPASAQLRKRPPIPFKGQVIDLPGQVTEMVLGARGRVAVLRLAQQNSIAIFDVVTGKTVKQIPCETNWRIAAGQKWLLLVDSATGKVQRWSLDSLQLIDTKNLTLPRPIGAVAMGCSSAGPLIVVPGSGQSVATEGIKLLDPVTLQLAFERIEEVGREPIPPVKWDQVRQITASPVGNAFCLPAAQCVLQIEAADVFVEFVDSRKTLFPGPIGEYFYGDTMPIDRFYRSLPTRRQLADEIYTRPDVDGPFYLQSPRLAIALAGTDQTLAQPDALPPSQIKLPDGHTTPAMSFLKSGANMMFSIVNDNRQLQKISFDTSQLLADGPAGALQVVTTPPTFVAAGSEFHYQVRARTNGAKVNYVLENGPSAMQVSESGLVTWKIPSTVRGPIATVIVRATSEPNLRTLHRFKLEVIGAKVDPDAAPDSMLLEGPLKNPSVITPLDLGGKPRVVDLASQVSRTDVAGSGRMLLLRMQALGKLAVFDVSQGKVVGYVPLSSEKTLFAGSADFIVTVDGENLLRWKLSDLSFDKSTRLILPMSQPRPGIGVATESTPLSPTFVGVGSASDGPITIIFPPPNRYSESNKISLLDGKTLQTDFARDARLGRADCNHAVRHFSQRTHDHKRTSCG